VLPTECWDAAQKSSLQAPLREEKGSPAVRLMESGLLRAGGCNRGGETPGYGVEMQTWEKTMSVGTRSREDVDSWD